MIALDRLQWAEYRGELAPDIARAWSLQYDRVMAMGAVFERKDGQFIVCYSKLNEMLVTTDGPFLNLRDSKRHMEHVQSTQNLRAKPVLLDSGFRANINSPGVQTNG